MGEELEKMKTALMDKEADLVASRKARHELERVLKSHQIRTQIERQTMEDMHNETIKVGQSDFYTYKS